MSQGDINVWDAALNRITGTDQLTCPYCDKPLPDMQARCCGEIGHAVETRAPDLADGSGSWIVSDKNGNAVWETFRRESADRAVKAGWTVETTAAYLARLNRRIRNAKRN